MKLRRDILVDMALHLALDEWAASIPEKFSLATDKALWSAAACSAPYTHFGAAEHKSRTGRVHFAPRRQTMSSRG
jgi:hypothetical protein